MGGECGYKVWFLGGIVQFYFVLTNVCMEVLFCQRRIFRALLCYRYVYDTENDERHVERESHRLGVVCKVGKSNTAAETELGPMTRR